MVAVFQLHLSLYLLYCTKSWFLAAVCAFCRSAFNCFFPQVDCKDAACFELRNKYPNSVDCCIVQRVKHCVHIAAHTVLHFASINNS